MFDGDPATPRIEGTPTTTQFLAHVYCGQTARWMKTPLGTEVDLGPGYIVLDGVPALRETGTAARIFSAHIYCGHGRPSQLLLSSCSIFKDNGRRHLGFLKNQIFNGRTRQEGRTASRTKFRRSRSNCGRDGDFSIFPRWRPSAILNL